MSALANCPFCGGSAEIREWDWPYIRYAVRCTKCGCKPNGRRADRGVAIAAWNTRAPNAAAEGLAKALEKILEFYGDQVCDCAGPRCIGSNASAALAAYRAGAA